MALDKTIDSVQLDSDLSDIADAIRAKSGSSSQLAFPAGFVSEIQGISSGWSIDGILSKTEPSGEITINVVPVSGRTDSFFGSCNGLTKVNILSRFTCKSFVNKCTNLEVLYAPLCTANGNTYYAENCHKMKTIVFGSPSTKYALAHMNIVNTIDITFGGFTGSYVFERDYALKNIILRKNGAIHALSNVNCFDSTPFKSGGTGGTIYIPEVLYNHLGDGTALDYKAATNWSTIDGYGTITWAKIEGSIYENQYADGHPLLHMTVAQNLTHCASSNNAASVELGKSFTTALTADAGYSLSSVTVTRAGTDITSTAYDSATGVVFVDNCYNDIVITATAA